MNDAFEYHPGPRLIVGEGGLGRLGELARDLGARRALIASDPGIVAAGHAAAGVAALEETGLTATVFSEFGENPSTVEIEAGVAVAREFRPDLLVGLGGGSSMDTAKGINFLYSCGGRMQDYRGHGLATGEMLPSLAVPTTAGTGSETQSFALITDVETGMKMACGDRRAAFRSVILDVTLTLTQPPRVAAVTGIDAVAHAVESFVSTAATPASRMLSREAWRLLAANLPRVFSDGSDIEARAAVQLAAAWAGLAIENAMLGAAHALANPLTATHGIVHGQAVGLMLPHVVRYNAPACQAAYGELLAVAGGPATVRNASSDAAGALGDWLDGLLAAAGLARSLAGLVATDPDVPALAAAAASQWTAGFNPQPVTAAELTAIYEAAR
ncbi:MAG: iron-containing alcohol dehydrogenase [Planctomycetota bacterium]|jgi:alcohol dehydrogenase|nr:iron-containing alcohol dehydrogenase [Planctomycetota bacterium]MDA1201679.1 iron-containing alcohol dehydrogenase [Planctomycetota bacterium]